MMAHSCRAWSAAIRRRAFRRSVLANTEQTMPKMGKSRCQLGTGVMNRLMPQAAMTAAATASSMFDQSIRREAEEDISIMQSGCGGNCRESLPSSTTIILELEEVNLRADGPIQAVCVERSS